LRFTWWIRILRIEDAFLPLEQSEQQKTYGPEEE
jgi:hypothetical protein